ncbi:MAG: hypothetical protein M1825_001053 [Sarcosagium campestre]|nr:MAG: hypothetical protein M1825_001053 [Sarcosagium campestre]
MSTGQRGRGGPRGREIARMRAPSSRGRSIAGTSNLAQRGTFQRGRGATVPQTTTAHVQDKEATQADPATSSFKNPFSTASTAFGAEGGGNGFNFVPKGAAPTLSFGSNQPSFPAQTTSFPAPSASLDDMGGRYNKLKKDREGERAYAVANNLVDDPGKQRRLEDAITFTGTCQDMCAEFERVERIVRNAVDPCEKVADSSGQLVPSQERMVKRFRRSAAGDEAQLPSDVRPPIILKKTLDYLIGDVVGGPQQLAKVHAFVWDRTRSIRNDFTLQNIQGSKNSDLMLAIECYEIIARFHIHSLHQLCRPDIDDQGFTAHNEREQLNKTLLSLLEFYELCASRSIKCANEAEFQAYNIMMHFHDQNIEREAMNLARAKPEIYDHPRVQMALQLYAAVCNTHDPHGPLTPMEPTSIGQNNFAKFFQVIRSKQISYTMACVAEIHFNHIRKNALQAIRVGYRSRATAQDCSLQHLMELLGFDDTSEAQGFCAACGMQVAEGVDGEFYLVLDSGAERLTDPSSLKQPFSRSLVEHKNHGRSLQHAIHGLTTRQARALTGRVKGLSQAKATEKPVTSGGVASGFDSKTASTAPSNPFAVAPTTSASFNSFGAGSSSSFGKPSTQVPNPFSQASTTTQSNPFGFPASTPATTSGTAATSATVQSPFTFTGGLASATKAPASEGQSEAEKAGPFKVATFDFAAAKRPEINTSPIFGVSSAETPKAIEAPKLPAFNFGTTSMPSSKADGTSISPSSKEPSEASKSSDSDKASSTVANGSIGGSAGPVKPFPTFDFFGAAKNASMPPPDVAASKHKENTRGKKRDNSSLFITGESDEDDDGADKNDLTLAVKNSAKKLATQPSMQALAPTPTPAAPIPSPLASIGNLPSASGPQTSGPSLSTFSPFPFSSSTSPTATPSAPVQSKDAPLTAAKTPTIDNREQQQDANGTVFTPNPILKNPRPPSPLPSTEETEVTRPRITKRLAKWFFTAPDGVLDNIIDHLLPTLTMQVVDEFDAETADAFRVRKLQERFFYRWKRATDRLSIISRGRQSRARMNLLISQRQQAQQMAASPKKKKRKMDDVDDDDGSTTPSLATPAVKRRVLSTSLGGLSLQNQSRVGFAVPAITARSTGPVAATRPHQQTNGHVKMPSLAATTDTTVTLKITNSTDTKAASPSRPSSSATPTLKTSISQQPSSSFSSSTFSNPLKEPPSILSSRPIFNPPAFAPHATQNLSSDTTVSDYWRLKAAGLETLPDGTTVPSPLQGRQSSRTRYILPSSPALLSRVPGREIAIPKSRRILYAAAQSHVNNNTVSSTSGSPARQAGTNKSAALNAGAAAGAANGDRNVKLNDGIGSSSSRNGVSGARNARTRQRAGSSAVAAGGRNGGAADEDAVLFAELRRVQAAMDDGIDFFRGKKAELDSGNGDDRSRSIEMADEIDDNDDEDPNTMDENDDGDDDDDEDEDDEDIEESKSESESESSPEPVKAPFRRRIATPPDVIELSD